MWQGPFYFCRPPTIPGPKAIQRSVKLLSSILVLLAAVSVASATPIQPDIKKLLSSPRPTQHFAPARVGWNGPEAAATTEALPAESLGNIGMRGDQRQMLLQIATPDWRIFLALAALIFLLRMLRKRGTPAYAPAMYSIPVDVGEPQVRRPAA
jgi:hypothetical protein